MRAIVRQTALFILLLILGYSYGFAHNPTKKPTQLDALRLQVQQLSKERKYKQAKLTAQRYVALARRWYGEENREFSLAMDWLACVYEDQGRYAKAEPLLRRMLEIDERPAAGRKTGRATGAAIQWRRRVAVHGSLDKTDRLSKTGMVRAVFPSSS